MYTIAHIILVLALLGATGGAIAGILAVAGEKTPGETSRQNSPDILTILQSINMGVTLCIGVASLFLLYALVTYDFSLEYVYSYTDRLLPLFYRTTAFWGGQAGSLLFWALMVALCGAFFQHTQAYEDLSRETKLWFWIFFLVIMGFFCFLLTTWNNPFIQYDQTPVDGRGLNPLLQNPGMIIHPPLLFLGYGGFVIPGCLALAQGMHRAWGSTVEEDRWIDVARPFTLTAWLFLTAGIVLGAWWAYMELGWGGYWAWDPVENASLIPWLIGTAALHTCIIESRRDKLHRVNIFLMALTTVSAFFATYLVRGNVVNSVHAFGAGSVGPSLLTFVLAGLLLSLLASIIGGIRNDKRLNPPETREGFIVMTAWVILVISMIILMATLWPVISSLWSTSPQGLTADFYNRVCLPLFTILIALLAICPWLKWNGGVQNWKYLGLVLGTFGLGLVVFWFLGVRDPLPLMSAALCAAGTMSIVLKLTESSVRAFRPSLAAYLVHLGVILMALGITFSGPYKTEVEIEMARGQNVSVGPYEVTLLQLYEGRDGVGTYSFIEAELEVRKNDKVLGIVAPQRRVYAKFGSQAFAESATYFSLGNEFYAALLGLDSEQRAVLRMSNHPLVNWLWVGGLIMTLAPFLGLSRMSSRRKKQDASIGPEYTH